ARPISQQTLERRCFLVKDRPNGYTSSRFAVSDLGKHPLPKRFRFLIPHPLLVLHRQESKTGKYVHFLRNFFIPSYFGLAGKYPIPIPSAFLLVSRPVDDPDSATRLLLILKPEMEIFLYRIRKWEIDEIKDWIHGNPRSEGSCLRLPQSFSFHLSEPKNNSKPNPSSDPTPLERTTRRMAAFYLLAKPTPAMLFLATRTGQLTRPRERTDSYLF
ncbi:transducin/WD40 repeat-like superfamily protein, partial [Striga asiatica]